VVLRHVVDHNFRAFFEEELAGRRELQYPPYSRVVLIETRGKEEGPVKEAAEFFARSLKRRAVGAVILGPAPAAIERIRNQYRWHVIAKNLKEADPAGAAFRAVLRQTLHAFAPRKSTNVQVILDVDPAGLM
jgi:primosomal protein N' (replication factor Y)